MKALAIYRDGSKDSQPLNTGTDATEAEQSETPQGRPLRRRLPDTRQSITHKFNVAGHEGYINVGLYEEGQPGELFITMAKEGSTIGGLMDSFGTAISLSLQYGVPLEVLVNKFSHTRFEPMGHTKNPDIRIAKSLVDYIFRWLGITFLPGYREANLGIEPATEEVASPATTEASQPSANRSDEPSSNGVASGHRQSDAAASDTAVSNPAANGQAARHDADPSGENLLELAGVKMTESTLSEGSRSGQFAGFQLDAPSCDNCGAITVRNGNCYLCHNCGNSMGCS